MALPTLLKIDASNRDAHYYIEEEHECFFFYEYTAREGPQFSDGNQFVFNLKKPVSAQNQTHYVYKNRAISRAGSMLRAVFERAPQIFQSATFAPIPPSRICTDPDYDDRMTRVITQACLGKNADVREIICQRQSYEASHHKNSGARLKPHELEALYYLMDPPPKPVVVLVDDVLTTGAHFVATRNTILAQYPDTQVFGFFMARRIVPNPLDDFDVL